MPKTRKFPNWCKKWRCSASTVTRCSRGPWKATWSSAHPTLSRGRVSFVLKLAYSKVTLLRKMLPVFAVVWSSWRRGSGCPRRTSQLATSLRVRVKTPHTSSGSTTWNLGLPGKLWQLVWWQARWMALVSPTPTSSSTTKLPGRGASCSSWLVRLAGASPSTSIQLIRMATSRSSRSCVASGIASPPPLTLINASDPSSQQFRVTFIPGASKHLVPSWSPLHLIRLIKLDLGLFSFFFSFMSSLSLGVTLLVRSSLCQPASSLFPPFLSLILLFPIIPIFFIISFIHSFNVDLFLTIVEDCYVYDGWVIAWC